MRQPILVVCLLFFVVTKVVAQGLDASSDTLRSAAKISYYDPTDYSAVLSELQRASQPSLWQKIGSAFTGHNNLTAKGSKLQLSGNIGVAYSQQTSAMLALSALGSYSVGSTPLPSTLALTAMVSVNGFYRLQAVGNNWFTTEDRLSYSIGGGSMPVRFWGLGYQAADKNHRSKYVDSGFDADVRYLRHIVGGLSLGVGVDFRYNKAHDVEPLAQEYLTQARVSTLHANTTGVALLAEYDHRRMEDGQMGGFYLSLSAAYHPEALGSHSSNLWHIVAVADYYQRLWQGAMLAVDLFADMWSWNTPWLFWSKVGGENRMRGYYYGRYTDRKMATAQAELRQTIYGPIGCVVWGGVGSVFASHRSVSLEELLPNYGVGLRLNLGEGSVLRIDYGFGRHSNGLVINLNEAF